MESREDRARRVLLDHKVKCALEEYEKFVSIKAREFAWGNHADREDFEQEGREAILRAVTTLEAKGDEGTPQYFRVAIVRAMIDYSRKLRRRNYQVWEYDGPSNVRRYRYGGEWKARIQYFGDKLERVIYQYQLLLDQEKIPEESE